jgi:hypothetical protein
MERMEKETAVSEAAEEIEEIRKEARAQTERLRWALTNTSTTKKNA